MSGRPWMPMYWGDYLQDTAHFTLAEHGAYMLLIAFYWTNGKLPDDEEAIRRIARMSGHQWSKSRATLRAKFLDGWIHKRVEEELAKSLEKSRTNSANAQRRHSGRTTDAQRSDTQSQSQSEKKDSEADASALPVPRETKTTDPRSQLFGSGLEILARITGRTPNSCRSLIGRWLKSVDDEAIHVLAAIEDAERERIADPSGWITARLSGKAKPYGFGGSRPLQDDGRSVSRAAGRLAEQAERGEFAFGPRPRLVPEENPNPVRLLSKG